MKAAGTVAVTACADAQAVAYLVERMQMRAEYDGLTGRSSDAMVIAAFGGEGPWITDYPSDRGDWRRCLLAYALAPEFLRERMRPTMREYRTHLRAGDPWRWHWSVLKHPSGQTVLHMRERRAA